jgi:hypothetical protein
MDTKFSTGNAEQTFRFGIFKQIMETHPACVPRVKTASFYELDRSSI